MTVICDCDVVISLLAWEDGPFLIIVCPLYIHGVRPEDILLFVYEEVPSVWVRGSLALTIPLGSPSGSLCLCQKKSAATATDRCSGVCPWHWVSGVRPGRSIRYMHSTLICQKGDTQVERFPPERNACRSDWWWLAWSKLSARKNPHTLFLFPYSPNLLLFGVRINHGWPRGLILITTRKTKLVIGLGWITFLLNNLKKKKRIRGSQMPLYIRNSLYLE